MPSRRNKIDGRNVVIVLLLGLVAVLFVALWSKPSDENLTVVSKPKAQLPLSSPQKPKPVVYPKPSAQPVAPIVKKEEFLPPFSVDVVKIKPKSPVPHMKQGEIAIVLDDWGYQLSSCQTLKEIAAPIAVAILPGLEFSRQIAICAHQNNKDVMLHLPLEPHQYFERYPPHYYIKTSMIKAQIERKIDEAIEQIPYVKGVNNHTGSKATEHYRTMDIVLRRIKKKGLFFLDSFVTGQSICQMVARRINMDFARRDVFLDNEDDRRYIEGQFEELARIARQKGFAIGLGHDRPLTLRIVKEQVEKLTNEGFEIVPIERLLRKP